MSRACSKRRGFRRLLADDRGASALEFSLVLMPFLLLLIGTMELGRYYFTVENLRTVVAEAGRAAVINSSLGASGTSCTGGSGNQLTGSDLTTVAQRTPFLNTSGLTVCVQNGAGPGLVTINVKATYSFYSPFPFIAQLNGSMTEQSSLTLKRL